MSKKKKNKVPQKFSPKAYLRNGQARKLPIHHCLVPDNWRELKKFTTFVARKHINGNITFACFLVDLLCTGIKDATFKVNMDVYEYKSLINSFEMPDIRMIEVDYVLAHNIVWAAEAYAADFNIEPHADFALASMVLEEDTDDIPLMEIPTGEHGKPLLSLSPGDPKTYYYKNQMDKYAGLGNYDYIIGIDSDKF